jgi:hypothetical protein
MIQQDGVFWLCIANAVGGLLFIGFALWIRRDSRGMPFNLWRRWFHGLFGGFLFIEGLAGALLRSSLSAPKAPFISYIADVVTILSVIGVILILFAVLAFRQSRI